VPDTWSLFLVKQLRGGAQHEWYRINIYTRWLSSRQTIVLVFDAPPPFAERLPRQLLDTVNPDHLGDPFWIYVLLADEVIRLQDPSVWAIRDQVRAIETESVPTGKPNPDYRRLHDTARHAIHVSETLDLAVKTMGGVLTQHQDFTAAASEGRDVSNDIRRRLLFYEHVLTSLRSRSVSNKERLLNEIQLAFNTVAQYDAGISVEIGRAAQGDGAAMKTIAFLTLAFLPATFISAVFSTSFFSYDADSGDWSVSDKFWVYWAYAVPTTLATSVLWYVWRKVFPPSLVGAESGHSATVMSDLSRAARMLKAGEKVDRGAMV
jgi:Mg2+ and Co2+ transporter CorA